MKRIVTLLLIGVFTLAIQGCCCSIYQDLAKSHHEDNSTTAILNTSMTKINDAIPETAFKAGYTVSQTKSTLGEFEYKGSGIIITGKKLDDNRIKIFSRTGFSGDYHLNFRREHPLIYGE